MQQTNLTPHSPKSLTSPAKTTFFWGGHPWWCSGFTCSSVLRNHYWLHSGDHLGCQGSNLDLLYASILQLYYYYSNPPTSNIASSLTIWNLNLYTCKTHHDLPFWQVGSFGRQPGSAQGLIWEGYLNQSQLPHLCTRQMPYLLHFFSSLF